MSYKNEGGKALNWVRAQTTLQKIAARPRYYCFGAFTPKAYFMLKQKALQIV